MTAASKSVSSKSAAKASPAKKATSKTSTKKAAAPAAPVEAGMQTVQPSEPNRMLPAIIPTDNGIALAGPLARKEIVEHLAESVEELGIDATISETGVVMAPEERNGDRRQADRRHADPLAQFVSQQMTTPAAPVSANNGASESPEAKQAEAETNQEVATDAAVQATGQAAAPASQAAPTLPQGFLEELAKLQEKFGVPIAPPSFTAMPAGRPGRDVKNGITRPGPGTKTGFIWEKADEITNIVNKGQPASIEQLKMHPDVRHFNDHTIRTQYARWRAYNKISGRVATPQQFAAPAAAQATPQATPSSVPAAPQGGNTLIPGPGGAQMLVTPEPMADQVYQNFLNMKKNNTLPAYLEPLLQAETARRDAEGAQHNQP
jgi:hypothetical protein